MLGASAVSLLSVSRRVTEARIAIQRKASRTHTIRRELIEVVPTSDRQIRDLQLDLGALERTLAKKVEAVRQAFEAHHVFAEHHNLPLTLAAASKV